MMTMTTSTDGKNGCRRASDLYEYEDTSAVPPRTGLLLGFRPPASFVVRSSEIDGPRFAER